MRESSTYRAIIAEGRAAEALENLLRLGQKQFGAPDAPTEVAIRAISNRKRLESLLDRVLDVSSWDELLATSSPHRPRRRNEAG